MELKTVMEDIVKDIADATKTLFETMIMMDLKYDHSLLSDQTNIKTDVTVLVSFMGKYHGIVGLFCSKSLSLKMASSMLMEEMTDFTPDAIDAIGEISNMIAGNVKTKISADYGEMGLSIPIILLGNNVTTNNTSLSCITKEPWLMTYFKSGDETFNVGLLLKESTS